MRSGISGERASRPSMTRNPPSRARPAAISSKRGGVAPAGLVGAHDPEDQQREADRRGQRAAQVEVPGAAGIAALQRAGAGPRRRRCSPIGTLMKRIQRQESRSVSTPPSSTPAAPPAPPMAPQMPTARLRAGALGEGGGEDRQRGRCDHGAAEPLDGAGGDQHGPGCRRSRRPARPARTAPGRRRTPGGGPSRSAARPPSSRKPGEGDRVGVDHPLQVDLGEVRGRDGSPAAPR